MKTKFLPFLLAALLFACEEDEKDIFSGKWSYESTQTDLKMNFELWRIHNEETYRIKYTSVSFGQTELPPTAVNVSGSDVLTINIKGAGYDATIKDAVINGSDMKADINLEYSQPVNLPGQIIKRVSQN